MVSQIPYLKNKKGMRSSAPTLHEAGFLSNASMSSVNRHGQHQQLNYSGGPSICIIEEELYRVGLIRSCRIR